VDRLVEAGVEDAGDRPQVVTPYGEDPPVEILPLHLDHLQVADQHLRGRAVELAEPGQVDRDAASVDGRVGEVDDVGSPVAFLARQELVDGHLVEAGEALQPRYRDRTLAPLVRAEHRRLELLSRPGFDVLQREALLAANRPEALADLAAVASRVFQLVVFHRCLRVRLRLIAVRAVGPASGNLRPRAERVQSFTLRAIPARSWPAST